MSSALLNVNRQLFTDYWWYSGVHVFISFWFLSFHGFLWPSIQQHLFLDAYWSVTLNLQKLNCFLAFLSNSKRHNIGINRSPQSTVNPSNAQIISIGKQTQSCMGCTVIVLSVCNVGTSGIWDKISRRLQWEINMNMIPQVLNQQLIFDMDNF